MEDKSNSQAGLSLLEEARADARLIADTLGREFLVVRVWLFGSTATGYFGPESDIDLVVEGLKEEDVKRAEERLKQITRFAFDLIRWEEAWESTLERLKTEGQVLWERPAP